MDKKDIPYIWIIILSVLFIGVSLNNMRTRDKKITSMVQKDTIPMSNLAFSLKKVSFGKVPDDTILKAKFLLYNTGEAALKIINVNPECSCTDYQLSKSEIIVGDSALLTICVNTQNKYGKQEIRTVLKANTPESMYLLTVLADVYEKRPISVKSE